MYKLFLNLKKSYLLTHPWRQNINKMNSQTRHQFQTINNDFVIQYHMIGDVTDIENV